MAGLTVLLGSNMGIPLSTTHCKVGAVVSGLELEIELASSIENHSKSKIKFLLCITEMQFHGELLATLLGHGLLLCLFLVTHTEAKVFLFFILGAISAFFYWILTTYVVPGNPENPDLTCDNYDSYNSTLIHT